jgi:hypothetical protein
VIDPKLRACLKQDRIRRVLAPRQSGANKRNLDRLIQELKGTRREKGMPPTQTQRLRFGYAAELPALEIQPCRHLAQSMMVLGNFTDWRHIAANAFACLLSVIMFAALPDLRSVLRPYPAPVAVPPASSSPYSLWVSLDTPHPEYFSAVLESGYWSNRRAEVRTYGGVTPSTRAEIHLHRVTGMKSVGEDDGIVWIERRRRFLFREFYPGKRVGRYSISYLTRLGHQ